MLQTSVPKAGAGQAATTRFNAAACSAQLESAVVGAEMSARSKPDAGTTTNRAPKTVEVGVVVSVVVGVVFMVEVPVVVAELVWVVVGLDVTVVVAELVAVEVGVDVVVTVVVGVLV